MRAPSLLTWRSATSLAAVALAALCAAPRGEAKIEPLTLAQMVAKAEGCVLGRISAVEVQRVDHPSDGPDLFFTTLSIQGRSLYDGRELTQRVTYAGGTLTDGTGAWNAEAPSADDVRVGNRVLAFHKWSDNLGGEIAAHALYAAHGGLYRVMNTRKGELVLGRGQGYAVENNRALAEFERDVARLRQR